MSVNIKRLITLLLAVILVIGLPVSAMAATVETGTDETQSSVTEETEPAPIEPTEPLDTTPTEITIPEEETEDSTVPADTSEDAADETEPIDELEASIAIMSLDDGIAAIAETEIVGAPNAFANLFLLNGGIDIPSFDHVQHKEHLPLYSVYLKDQPGYANNYYVAYCIEPGVELGNSGGHSGSSTTVGGMTDGSGALSSLTRDQVSAMGVALLYGETSIASRNDAESVRLEKLRRHAATQAIIWEIACGWRSSTPPYTRNNSTLYDAICPTLEIAVQVWGTKFNIDGIGDSYNEIVTKMAKHYTIPSFAASSQSAAKTYSLTPDVSGKYSITLTDTNNILSEYTFTNTSNVTYTVNGNKLTITASSPVTDMVVSPTKQVPNLENQVFYVWEYKEQQKLMSCKSEPANSAVPAYFKISTPNDGGLDLTKTTEDGKNLAGWKFGIYSDANCSTLISGPHTTDSSGKISVTGLSAGTVYVKELGHTDAAIDALYKCTSTNPQKVTITSGKTAAVSFNNDLRTGYGKIVKETNTGENLSGWKFNVYTDAACKNPIDGSPFTTDSNGTITLELTPADYYVQEVDESGTNPDWTYDTTVDSGKYYYTSDTLNKALAEALADNSTVVKNALEAYAASSGNAIVMDKTNENGKTIQRGLNVGLWICIETKTSEQITSTTPPFLVSLPMTTVSGDENSSSPEGGHFWNYDVVVYPKQETGIPTLTKEVRESASQSTGKNDGTDAIDDGFAHNATGSAGDVMEYQILSTLPSITSKATSLCKYGFYDSISEGLTYCKAKKDVKIEFFTDADCTDKVTTWTQGDGRFTVEYSSDDRHMTIDVTQAGLDEINGNTENVKGKLYAGYSNYTARVTYTAAINSDATFVYGDNGNDNKVVLTWKRTSSDYYDTLIDDCHVYSFGIDITKLFSDVDSETAEETGMFKHVKFKIYNATDGYWVTATRNDAEGVYYVTGHVTDEADATVFYPVTMGDELGQVMVKGCEDDEYIITECETANGYTLLENDIHVVITASEDENRSCDIYTEDVLGVLQNDPHYSFDGGYDLTLANIPQKQLAHFYLTGSATVDTNEVNMLEDNGSANAEAPLTIVNTKGFDLPKTGDTGVWMYGLVGILLMAGSITCIVLTNRKKRNTH